MKLYTSTNHSQYISKDDGSPEVQVFKLKPNDFNAYPQSSKDKTWYQVPGYRIILVPTHRDQPIEIQPYIDFLLRDYINNPTHAHVYKRYQIREHGQG